VGKSLLVLCKTDNPEGRIDAFLPFLDWQAGVSVTKCDCGADKSCHDLPYVEQAESDGDNK